MSDDYIVSYERNDNRTDSLPIPYSENGKYPQRVGVYYIDQFTTTTIYGGER